MKRTSPMKRVRMAEAELASAERALVASAQPWRLRMRRHRSALILCGGFASGLALTFFPPRWWARIGAFAGSSAATAARSAFTPAVITAVLAHFRRGNAVASETPSEVSASE
jgi:hypothetical protein